MDSTASSDTPWILSGIDLTFAECNSRREDRRLSSRLRRGT
jgi:hypothetical protein